MYLFNIFYSNSQRFVIFIYLLCICFMDRVHCSLHSRWRHSSFRSISVSSALEVLSIMRYINLQRIGTEQRATS